MNKTEPVGEWIKRQGRVHIRYGDAIELIQEIQTKRDNLGLELSEWVKFGDDVIGRVCDMFDIEVPEVEKKTKDVTTIIDVWCDGKMERRTVYVNWWKELSINDIADTTAKIVEEIVGRGELEEGTI